MDADIVVAHTLNDLKKYSNRKIIGSCTNILLVHPPPLVLLGSAFRASHSLYSLAKAYMALECSGMEFAAGIPGTLGGAIKTNAGGKWGCMADIVETVTVFHENSLHEVKPVFSYRSCALDGIILDAHLKLRPLPKRIIKKRMTEIWREKARQQPLKSFNAGCIFKNTTDVTAAELIEQSGLKGFTIGTARVSFCHANFIECLTCPNPHDILALIEYVKKTVYDKTEKLLSLEIEIL